MKFLFKFFIRLTLGILLLIFSLLLVVCLFLFVPKVQKYVSQQASSYLSDKIGTTVELEAIYLAFPNGVSIHKLYVEDKVNDTLLYTGNLEVSVDYFALIHGEVEVSNILLEHTTAKLKVAQDSSFNFDFILDAFASDSTVDTIPQDTSSSNISFDVGEIELNDVRFSYYSEPDGMSTFYSVGHLYLDVDKFDLEKQIYTANKIELSNTNGKFEFFKSAPSSEEISTDPTQLIVGSETIEISQTNFQFVDKTSDTEFSTKIGYLNLEAEPIDLAQQKIDVSQIKVDSSEVLVKISALAIDSTGSGSEDNGNGTDWLINLQELELNLLQFKFDDVGSAKTNKGIDYAHLNLNINQLKSESIYYNGIEDLGMQLNQLSATEQSGLKVKQAAFVFKMDATSIETRNLELETPNTSIIADAKLGYESMSTIADKLGDLKVQLQFNKTKIGLSDINYFAPDLDTITALKPYLKQDILLEGKLDGAVNNLRFSDWMISLAQSTTLKLNGKLSGLPETDQLAFNFNQIQLISNPKDLKTLLPDSTIPNSIHLPPAIKLDIIGKGKIDNFTSQLNLKTTYGNLNSKFDFQRPDSNTSAYQLIIDIPSCDVAQLLQDTVLGNIGFKGEINGKGLKLEEMELDLDATISQLEYANYQYSDLKIKGNLQENAFEGDISMNDSNLIFEFTGKADLDSLKPAFDFSFNLEGIDLQHLNITKEDYRINGKLNAKFEGNTLENLNGNLDVRDILIIHKGEQYRVDSLLFVSIVDSGKTDINIKSNLLDASFKGNIYLSDLAETLRSHFQRRLLDSTRTTNTKNQDFKFNVRIHDPDILTEVLLPDLNSFETGEISGEFDSQKDVLAIELNFPKIDYLDIVIDSLSLSANSDSNKINSILSIRRVSYDTLSIENIAFSGKTKGKEAILSLQVLKANQEKLLQLKGKLDQPKDVLRFHFEEKEQFINAKQWKVNQANEILFGDSTIFKNIVFSNDSQKLAIETKGKYNELSFLNFKLSSIFNLISQNQEQIGQFNSSYEAFNKKLNETGKRDTIKEKTLPLFKGILNGKINFPVDSMAKLKAALNLKDLQLNDVLLGNLQANYSQLTNKDSIYVLLDGNENHLEIKGFIAENEMNIDLDIKKLKMNIVEAFSGGELKSTQGYLTANAQLIKQNGSYNSKGELGFKDVRVRSTYLGETYFLQDEKIQFANEKITLNKFTILDSAKQSFVTDGNIGLKELSNPSFNLKVKIDHFQFLNTSKEGTNDLFYGTVLVSADLKVTGNLIKPKVSAKLSLEKGTDITFVVPEEQASEVNREGIVVFVDKDEKIPLLLRRDKSSDTVKVDVLGVDFTSVINIDDNTKLTLIIDPITGDRLKIQGGGEIRADVDPTGRVTMNGLYTIENGDYELKLYNLVKRKFALEKGSKLVWNGPPLEAKMDIKGVFVAKASPLGLLGDQVSNLSEAERNSYKKRIPFKVLLILGGEILQPDISFRIELPEDQKASSEGAVANKLAQLNEDESELNRQVFSLIILKRFYTQSPTSGGGGGSYVARESVSQILTQQLNNLSDKYVKGVNVELSVDSYNDYSTEGELEGTTDVNLALSKNLFDDRVTVSVNGDFNVENNSQQASNSAIAGDVAVEYKITEDGKYRVKVFRKDEYEGIIEGEYIETGVSLIYNREFVKFKDLFRKEENQTIKTESE